MKKNNKKGFTIVELVIVIAVIAILAAVLIPTFSSVTQSAKESAARQQARSGMQSILNLTEATMSEKTQFLVSENDDGAINYKYVYEGNQLKALEDTKVIVGKHGTGNDAHYVAYISAENFVLDEDKNVVTSSPSKDTIKAKAKKMLCAAVGKSWVDSYATDNDTNPTKFAKDYAILKMGGDTFYIYWTSDIKSTLLVMIAPVGSTPAVQTVTVKYTATTITADIGGKAINTTAKSFTKGELVVTLSAEIDTTKLTVNINGDPSTAYTYNNTAKTITFSASQVTGNIEIALAD